MVKARICRLTLSNFRSYHAANVAVGGDLVVLVGANGAGKTNLLEAISLFSPGRGLRRADTSELAFNEGDGSWAISAEVDGALGLVTLGTGIEPPANADAAPVRKYRIDREPAGSAAAFADHLRVIWLVPAMDQLFAGPASERRRFLDRLVLAVDAGHAAQGLRARARAALAQPAAGKSPPRHPLARCRRARDRGGRGCGRRGARRDGASAFRGARGAARHRDRLSVRRDRPRRLDGGRGARRTRRRGRGPLSRRAAREPWQGRRRRAHARRAASHRSPGRLRAEGHRRPRCLDRRAEGAADRPRPRPCRASSPT